MLHPEPELGRKCQPHRLFGNQPKLFSEWMARELIHRDLVRTPKPAPSQRAGRRHGGARLDDLLERGKLTVLGVSDLFQEHVPDDLLGKQLAECLAARPQAPNEVGRPGPLGGPNRRGRSLLRVELDKR